MNNNNHIQYLLDIVSGSFQTKDQQKLYKPALRELNVKFLTAPNEKYFSVDDFAVECLELFYIEEKGLPNEIYKGYNLDDAIAYINDLVRDFKIALCDTIKKHPDKNLTNTADETWKDIIKWYIGTMVTKLSGVPNEVTAILISAFVVYCINTAITDLCG